MTRAGFCVVVINVVLLAGARLQASGGAIAVFYVTCLTATVAITLLMAGLVDLAKGMR